MNIDVIRSASDRMHGYAAQAPNRPISNIREGAYGVTAMYAPFRHEESRTCVRGVVAAIALLVLSAVFDPGPAGAQNATAQTANEGHFNPFAPGPKGRFLAGAGDTYH